MPAEMVESSANVSGGIQSAPRPHASAPWVMQQDDDRSDIGASSAYQRYAQVGKLSPGDIPEGHSPNPDPVPCEGGFVYR